MYGRGCVQNLDVECMWAFFDDDEFDDNNSCLGPVGFKSSCLNVDCFGFVSVIGLGHLQSSFQGLCESCSTPHWCMLTAVQP